MRVFAVSDLHVDYQVNARWVEDLSLDDYRDDILIVAGDVSDSMRALSIALTALSQRFRQVLYVPGNHELWVHRERREQTSIEKFTAVCEEARNCGASTNAYHTPQFSVVPLFGWYDFSFGEPSQALRDVWMDFYACRWPSAYSSTRSIADFFEEQNDLRPISGSRVITFSHFLPRIDVMPRGIPLDKQLIYPVLGAASLDTQLRRIGASIHVYGHSHINTRSLIDGVTYINSAFGYPHEQRITGKSLACILQC